MTSTARFEFRIPPEAKTRIEEAAALSGETASDFARQAAIARAEEILSRQTTTLVPPDFFDVLLRELDEPAEPNERLADAARRRAKLREHRSQ
ncbi:MAG: DUF1778 domain-containing protein [Pseudonocardia sp.]|nr:DUF1778 domain-containing protein [Pseudonocardia sp.]